MAEEHCSGCIGVALEPCTNGYWASSQVHLTHDSGAVTLSTYGADQHPVPLTPYPVSPHFTRTSVPMRCPATQGLRDAYEMHIYTMGDKTYAAEVRRCVGLGARGTPSALGRTLKSSAALMQRQDDLSSRASHRKAPFLPSPTSTCPRRLLDPTGRLFSSVVAKDHSTQATAKHLVRRHFHSLHMPWRMRHRSHTGQVQLARRFLFNCRTVATGMSGNPIP